MTPEDEADFERFKKLLDRLGKAMIMSAEAGDLGDHPAAALRVGRPAGRGDARRPASTPTGSWSTASRSRTGSRPTPPARHSRRPTRSTRRCCRSSSASGRRCRASSRPAASCACSRSGCRTPIRTGFKGAHKDPLIGMGTAPLDDPLFRSAVFEQLGSGQLEGAVTTDICGKKDSHAVAPRQGGGRDDPQGAPPPEGRHRRSSSSRTAARRRPRPRCRRSAWRWPSRISTSATSRRHSRR